MPSAPETVLTSRDPRREKAERDGARGLSSSSNHVEVANTENGYPRNDVKVTPNRSLEDVHVTVRGSENGNSNPTNLQGNVSSNVSRTDAGLLFVKANSMDKTSSEDFSTYLNNVSDIRNDRLESIFHSACDTLFRFLKNEADALDQREVIRSELSLGFDLPDVELMAEGSEPDVATALAQFETTGGDTSINNRARKDAQFATHVCIESLLRASLPVLPVDRFAALSAAALARNRGARRAGLREALRDAPRSAA